MDISKRKKYIFQRKIPISLIIYSMQNRNKLEIKLLLKNIFLRDSSRKSGVGKMNGTAKSQGEITPAK
jgi:hypothetical protein